MFQLNVLKITGKAPKGHGSQDKIIPSSPGTSILHNYLMKLLERGYENLALQQQQHPCRGS